MPTLHMEYRMSNLETLHALATHAASQAYAPHSRLRVGAALRSHRGGHFTGCNVENASFTVGNCAERAAIAAAVAAEGPGFRLAEICIVALIGDDTPLPITPCGACRQVLVEFGEDAMVHFPHADGQWLAVRAGDLLPYRFQFPAS